MNTPLISVIIVIALIVGARELALCGITKLAARLPLWVKSGHRKGSAECALYPQKQTFVGASGMSACAKSRLMHRSKFASIRSPRRQWRAWSAGT